MFHLCQGLQPRSLRGQTYDAAAAAAANMSGALAVFRLCCVVINLWHLMLNALRTAQTLLHVHVWHRHD